MRTPVLLAALTLLLLAGCHRQHYALQVAAAPPSPLASSSVELGSTTPTPPQPPPHPATPTPSPPGPVPLAPPPIAGATPPTGAPGHRRQWARARYGAPPLHHSASRSPASTTSAPPTTQAAAPPTSTAAQQEALAYTNAKVGQWTYIVPPEMKVGSTYPVSATILSSTAPVSEVPDGSAKPTPLKVSDYMLVTLDTGNEAESFTIQRAPDSNACQNLPTGGSQTWQFLVTPKILGAGRAFALHADHNLVFTAYMVFGEESTTCSRPNADRRLIQSAQKTVKITAIDPPGLWDQFLAYVHDNPGKCLLWLLPGGAGFLALQKGIAWLRNHLKSKSISSGSPTPGHG